MPTTSLKPFATTPRQTVSAKRPLPRTLSMVAGVTPQEHGDFLPGALEHQLRTLAKPLVALDPSALSPEEFYRRVDASGAEVMLACWKTPPLPENPPSSLRYVCYLAGSVKKLVTRRHLERGLIVTNWGGSISRIVAEWALFHILSGLRRASYWAVAMHTRGVWKNGDTETGSLFGRRVGIHGFGLVARELVKLLEPFGVTISVLAPDCDTDTARGYGVQVAPSLEALFGENDVVVELSPLIPETTGIVTEALLRRIQPGGVFVNLGRGAVVDQEALLRVAKEGSIQLGLDVFAEEPLPPDSPFRGLLNVFLTPHIGGPTTDRRCDSGAFALANLQAYADGAPLQAVVTPEIFDRSS
jgi:phosphoglycerate dehydrogenase-like enzyme